MDNSEALLSIQQADFNGSAGCVPAGWVLIPSGNREFVQTGYAEDVQANRFRRGGKLLMTTHKVRILSGGMADECWDEPDRCEICGAPMHRNGIAPVVLRDVPFGCDCCKCAISRIRCRCSKCGHCQDQPVPFKSSGHMITRKLEEYTEALLEEGGTLKSAAEITGLGKNVVKEIDKQRLERYYVEPGKDGRRVLKKPERQARILGIDEFLLHEGHQYATVIIDMDTGVILWIAKGRKKEVVYGFIEHVGLEWMSKVEAVSCDMNSDFIEAFQEKCPHVKAVYDRFHIVKNFNDKVANEVRKDMIKELTAEGKEDEAARFKHAKYLLMSSRSTMRQKDQEAGKIIGKGSELFNIPPSTRNGNREERYDELIRSNELLFMIDWCKEALRDAYEAPDAEDMRRQIENIISKCESTGNRRFFWFARLLGGHLDGIATFADYKVTNSKLEGINQRTKTLRRNSYGLPDDEYFFLKLIDSSHKGIRHEAPHRI